METSGNAFKSSHHSTHIAKLPQQDTNDAKDKVLIRKEQTMRHFG